LRATALDFLSALKPKPKFPVIDEIDPASLEDQVSPSVSSRKVNPQPDTAGPARMPSRNSALLERRISYGIGGAGNISTFYPLFPASY